MKNHICEGTDSQLRPGPILRLIDAPQWYQIYSLF